MPLKTLLDEIGQNNYTLKVMSTNQIKIQPMSTENYLPIMNVVKEKQTQCYTYQRKQDRNFRVVLKGIHPTASVEEIKKELKQELDAGLMIQVITRK